MNTSKNAARYKNAGLDSAEMRRRREEDGIQLRKQKREQQLTKRRNRPDLQHELYFACMHAIARIIRRI